MTLKIFSASSSVASDYVSVTVTVDADYKIISGGGRMTSGDILMIETYPVNGTSWTATLTEHVVDTTGRVAAYAIGLYDPGDEWDVSYTSAESGSSDYVFVSAAVPSGYQMTGGGAQVTSTDSGAGIVLFGSYPVDANNWMAVGNQHRSVGTGMVKAYAIGNIQSLFSIFRILHIVC